MKIKDLIEELTKFNPDANVNVVTNFLPYDFSLAWSHGGECEECDKSDVESVSFYVDSLNKTDIKK